MCLNILSSSSRPSPSFLREILLIPGSTWVLLDDSADDVRVAMERVDSCCKFKCSLISAIER